MAYKTEDCIVKGEDFSNSRRVTLMLFPELELTYRFEKITSQYKEHKFVVSWKVVVKNEREVTILKLWTDQDFYTVYVETEKNLPEVTEILQHSLAAFSKKFDERIRVDFPHHFNLPEYFFDDQELQLISNTLLL